MANNNKNPSTRVVIAKCYCNFGKNVCFSSSVFVHTIEQQPGYAQVNILWILYCSRVVQ